VAKKYTREMKQRTWELRSKGLSWQEITQALLVEFPHLDGNPPDTSSLKRWYKIGAENGQRISEAVSPEARRLSPAKRYPQAYEDLGDIPGMEWNIDELRRRHIPDREAVKLLRSYRRLINLPALTGVPLVDDSMYLVLCFKVQLYNGFPSIQARKVARLARMYLTGLMTPSAMEHVRQSLMFESRSTDTVVDQVVG